MPFAAKMRHGLFKSAGVRDASASFNKAASTGYSRKDLKRMSAANAVVSTFDGPYLLRRCVQIFALLAAGYLLAKFSNQGISVSALELRLASVRQEAESSSDTVLQLKQKLEVQRIAIQKLSTQMQAMEQQRIALQQDLAFYKNIAGKADKSKQLLAKLQDMQQASAAARLAVSAAPVTTAVLATASGTLPAATPVMMEVKLRSFAVSRQDEPGQYRFSILLAKETEPTTAVQGELKLSLSGLEVDRPVNLDWSGEPLKVNFKQSQRLSGDMEIPEYWAGKKLRASLYEAGKAKATYSWVVRVPD